MHKPKSTESLSEGVRNRLERDILSGALAPGQALDERSLADQFGVSRTPVRNAIAQLASQGLLRVVPRVGVVVPKLNIKELLSLLEMLVELEGICAKFAAHRMNASERKALRTAMQRCEAAATAGNAKAYATANQSFHEVIYGGCRNEWAATQVRSLRLRCSHYRRSRFDLPGAMEKSLLEHRAVVEAIARGDAEASRLAMSEHIAVGGKDLAEFVNMLEPEILEQA
jgi:DNA-binding GntR family transcriptional regulator